jgi:hypothetical protein
MILSALITDWSKDPMNDTVIVWSSELYCKFTLHFHTDKLKRAKALYNYLIIAGPGRKRANA